MARILKYVLGKSERIQPATMSYIDDIIIDNNQIEPDELISHLNNYGFETKPAELLDGGAALRLKLNKNEQGELIFSRGNSVPKEVAQLSRRQLFSLCGKLIGHYPVAGWLRVACSFMKRSAEGERWDDSVGDGVILMINDVLQRVQTEDPVRGSWYVARVSCGDIWCDASSVAIGALVEINGKVVEDAAWLRGKDDVNHINVAELESVLKGLNMALKWKLRKINIMTDSVTVRGWLNTVITEDQRVQTKGASEMLIKRRLSIFKDIISEFGLVVSVTLVPSVKNKADILTRVKKGWLTISKSCNEEICAAGISLEAIHGQHHMGVDRTFFLARQMDPEVRRADVRKVVRSCEKCQSIDPAPVTHERGSLSITDTWTRIAIDVTHYHHVGTLFVTHRLWAG